MIRGEALSSECCDHARPFSKPTWALDPLNCAFVFTNSAGYVTAPSIAPAIIPAVKLSIWDGELASVREVAMLKGGRTCLLFDQVRRRRSV